MKISKGNSLQLIISGAVLIVVAVCGTIAWFGQNPNAGVDTFLVNVTSPSLSSGVDVIEYQYNDEWYEYNGSENLTIIPGQTIKFRVKFSGSSASRIVMKLTDLVASGGNVPFTDAHFVTGEIPQLCSLLQYGVNSAATYTAFTDSLVFNPLDNNKPELIMMTDHQVLAGQLISGQQYAYYYDIHMPGTVGNEYQSSTISFNLEMTII